MWSRSGFFVEPAAASGLKPLRRFPCLDLRTFLFRVRFFSKPSRIPSKSRMLHRTTPMREIKLQDLKSKAPAELVSFAEENAVDNASTMRKQELMFAILKQLAIQETDIIGEGVVEVLSDGFGFLRSPDANYLPGPDDIYVSPSQIRRFGLRTGDTIEGHIRSPKEGERYFALLKVNTLNFEDPEKSKHKVNFDNLTPLFPDQRFRLELEDPTRKDLSSRVIDIVAPIGKGQRALIVPLPRTGKNVLMQHIAHSITANHPECYLIVLLIQQQPHGRGDLRRIQGHRQLGIDSRSQGFRQAHLPGDRYLALRHPQGRADHRSATAEENVRAAPDPQSDGHYGRDRLPARQAAQHQEQRRVLRIDEYLSCAAGLKGGSSAPLFYRAGFMLRPLLQRNCSITTPLARPAF